MPVKLTAAEIREKYDRMAPKYDLSVVFCEVLGVSRLRRHLLKQAYGEVLEIAVGTGKNLSYYPEGCRITAVDISPNMLRIAADRAERLKLRVSFQVQDAGSLPFTDSTFDTIVSALSLCTLTDPMHSLREMARVCRKDGQILLLEHGRSDREWLGRWQDRKADKYAMAVGCHWNREPLDLVKEAGLTIVKNQRLFFGAIHVMKLVP